MGTEPYAVAWPPLFRKVVIVQYPSGKMRSCLERWRKERVVRRYAFLFPFWPPLHERGHDAYLQIRLWCRVAPVGTLGANVPT